MPKIFYSSFEEVTFVELKTSALFIEDDAYTFQDNHNDFEVSGPQKDVIYNNSGACFQLCISDEYSVILYKGDELSSYIIHGIKLL